MVSDDIVNAMRKILGEKGVRDETNDLLPNIILKPESTEQVAAILKFCVEAGQAISPIGG